MTNLLKAADAMAEALAEAQRCGHIEMIGWWDNAMNALSAYEAAKREAAKSNEAWKNEVNKFLGIGAHSHD